MEDEDVKCEFQPDGSYTSTPNWNEKQMKQIHDITNSLDLVGFTDKLDRYYEKIRQITCWKNEVKNIKRVHKSRSTFNLTRSLISIFNDLNQNDYMFDMILFIFSYACYTTSIHNH